MGTCASSAGAVSEPEPAHKRNGSLASTLGRTGHTAKSSSLRSSAPSLRAPMGSSVFGERYYFSYVLLGKGGEATVYEGIDKLSRRKVAIKIVLKSEMKKIENLDNLRREVDILGRMEHRGVMGLFDYFDEPARFIIVLEIGRGGSLFEKLMKNKRLSENDSRGVILNLTKAVEYMHSKDVVHRDLKPENILMKSPKNDFELMIADFGYAVVCADDSLSQQLGTPNYVAPEVLLRRPYGKSVDVWAIGVILFIALSGNFPFNHPDQNSLFRLIVKGRYSFDLDRRKWDDVSEEAKDLIAKILVVDVASRYSLADILSHPWMQREVAGMHPMELGLQWLDEGTDNTFSTATGDQNPWALDDWASAIRGGRE